jgi:hypothetical protein
MSYTTSEDVEWMQDSGQQWVFMNTAIKLSVPQKQGNFMSNQ